MMPRSAWIAVATSSSERFPQSLCRGHSRKGLWPSGLQHCQRTHCCCFKPRCLWSIFRAVIGNLDTVCWRWCWGQGAAHKAREMLKEAFCEKEKSCFGFCVVMQLVCFICLYKIESLVLLIYRRKERAYFCRPSLKKLTVRARGRLPQLILRAFPFFSLYFYHSSSLGRAVSSLQCMFLSFLKLILPS